MLTKIFAVNLKSFFCDHCFLYDTLRSSVVVVKKKKKKMLDQDCLRSFSYYYVSKYRRKCDIHKLVHHLVTGAFWQLVILEIAISLANSLTIASLSECVSVSTLSSICLFRHEIKIDNCRHKSSRKREGQSGGDRPAFLSLEVAFRRNAVCVRERWKLGKKKTKKTFRPLAILTIIKTTLLVLLRMMPRLSDCYLNY